MKSLILAESTQTLAPLLVFISIFMLLRGHNEPGGGFIGGLIAAAAIVLQMQSEGARRVEKRLHLLPHEWMAWGLLVAIGSACIGPLAGREFFAGVWTELAGVKLGTPLLFDIGVYLVVVGVILTIATNIPEPEASS